MNEINSLKCFLNSMKETIKFDDEKDFRQKINADKEFRIRVQKLVYLSKFFGWDNSYHFNFHQHGPYSCKLSEDYYRITSLKSVTQKLNMNHAGFEEFAEGLDNESLEALSTILYYLNKVNIKTVDEAEIVKVLGYLKPHLPKNIIESSFELIDKYNLLNHHIHNSSNPEKKIVADKLNGLINIFEDFETCSNQMLLLGSLDYFRLALKRENLKDPFKKEFLRVVYEYGEFVEVYYFNNLTIQDNLPYSDLSGIENEFDKLQNYVSDLNVLPRLYDEDVDLNIFLE